MNKKLALLAVGITISIIFGGMNSSYLYGTQYMGSEIGYLFSVSAEISWWNCSWSHRKQITIDHTMVQSDQTDYTVLIKCTDLDLASYARDDGFDIVFVNEYNSMKYNHEIEYFNNLDGDLVAWVRLDRISSTQDTILYMYYGNPNSDNQQNVAGTWDSSFKMVQHLNESSGVIYDSTSNNNDGANSGADYNSSSKIDGGYDFDGDAKITVAENSSLNITNSITLEAWIKDPPITKKESISTMDYDIKAIKEEIKVIKAEHLDKNRHIISDIYDAIDTKDGIWSESILNDEHVKITFEKPLSNVNDITIFARSSGIADVEIYTENDDTPIGKFEEVSNENWYKIHLTSLRGKHSIFYLKTVGSSVEYDYIVDPPLNTSVDSITPYWQKDSPLTITATNTTAVDNVTLWYRYSSDNITWEGAGYEDDWNIVELTSGSSWTIPLKVWKIDILVVGGGGGSGRGTNNNNRNPGGGGAGGLVWIQNVTRLGDVEILPGNNISYSVGTGGAGSGATGSTGTSGNPSIFGNITALGGGGGASSDNLNGLAGGSGGGGGRNPPTTGSGGAGNQPSQAGWSGSPWGRGNDGGSGTSGGGGGGAGSAGSGTTGGSGMDMSDYFGTNYGDNGVFSKGGDAASGSTASPANSGYGGMARATNDGGNGIAGAAGIILIRWQNYSGGWIPWDNTSNPDTEHPWSWDFDFPNGTGYYEFYSIGNKSGESNETPPNFADARCGYDNVSPTSTVNTITPYWQTTSPTTITATASDTGYSGLKNVTLYYYNSTDNNTWNGPYKYGNTNTTPWNTPITWNFNFPNNTGYYRFYSIATDNATNQETYTGNDTICGYDNIKPTSTVNTITPYWQTTSPTTITATASDTGYSGLKNVTLYYYNSTDNNTWNGPYKYGNTNTTPWNTPITWNFNFPNNTGYYRFYSIATDNATNQETYTGNDTICGYDNIKPTSTVNTITPYLTSSNPLTISATAYDDGPSGLKNVTLFHRHSLDNSSWGTWTKWNSPSNPDTVSPWEWDFNFPNGTGFYEFYSRAYDNASNYEDAPATADAICRYAISPSVVTNASTGVKETNATLWGYLQNNGSLDTTCGFRYGTISGVYTNNVTYGIVANASEFSENITGLKPGQIYYYQAWANNSIGFTAGSELTFLTKPSEPSNLHAQANNSQTIFLTWTNGTGANTTRIQRKEGSYPNSITDGDTVYNDTGTQYEDTGLDEGTAYYYRAWSYTTWATLHQYSDKNASASNTTNNIPTITDPYPTNGSVEIPLIPTLNITINDRDGDLMTIIWYSNSSGDWLEFGRNTTVGNGTYHQTNNNFSDYLTTYYWNVTVTDGRDTNTTWYYFTTIIRKDPPIVTTNTSTGVENINATLRGYLVTDGNLTTTVGFWYDTISGGETNNVTVGQFQSGETFVYDATGLIPGQIYYFRAWANNSKGFVNGSEMLFLTKPNATVSGSFHAQTNSSTKIYLTWTKGDGANTTYIERNTISSWARGSGTEVYNDTGASFEDAGLSPGATYYYQAWSFANWTNPTLYQWSNENESTFNKTKNVPILSAEYPANGSNYIYLNPTLKITVNHNDAYKMNITWYWGTDSSTPHFIGTNSSVENGTYTMSNNENFSLNSQIYYWRVTINDGHGEWTNATYHFTTIDKNKGVISKGQNAYSLELNPDGDTIYGYINGNYITADVPEPITDWHHVVMTYDGSQIRLYVNGVLQNSTSYSGAINTNTNDLLIGDAFTGTLDELRISNTARNAAWINTSYLNTNYPTTFVTFGEQQGILSTFNYRKQISINASMVDSDLSNFPVLVSITDNDLKNNADTTGYDIIFTSSEINWEKGIFSDILPHKIEKWDSSTGELVAWVKLDEVNSTTNTTFYMYYNSICKSDKQNTSGVWDDNYRAVYHMNDITTSTIRDSTANLNNGTKTGANSPQETDGFIAKAQDFPDDCEINISTGFSDIRDAVTVEVWIKPDTITADDGIVGQDSGAGSPSWIMHIEDSEIWWGLWTGGKTDWPANQTVKCTPVNAQWNYVVGTYNKENTRIYHNGTEKANASYTEQLNAAGTVYIGRYFSSLYRYDGVIDEVRISDVARSAAWINASYQTMSSPSTFLAFGAQEIPNVAPTQSNPDPANDAIGQNLNPTLSIQVNDTNNDAMNVTFRTNATGVWGDINSNNSVYNGIYSQINSSMNNYNTKYYWSVNVTDGELWTNATYSFTTRQQYIPEPPTDFTATTHNSTQINLSWTKGINATHTYIEYNSTEGPWTRGEGNLLYNGTDELYSHTGLDPDTTYYYQAWSYNATDKRYSTSYASDNNTTSI